MYMSTTQHTVQRAVSIVVKSFHRDCVNNFMLFIYCIYKSTTDYVYVCLCTTDLWHIVTGYGYQITSWTKKESGVVKDGHVVTLTVRLCSVQISNCVL